MENLSLQHIYDTLIKMSNDAYEASKRTVDFEKFKQLQIGKSEAYDIAAELISSAAGIYGIDLIETHSSRQVDQMLKEDARAEYNEQQRQEDAEAEMELVNY